MLNKYYGHRRYRIWFAPEELKRRNSDARAGRWLDLVDLYTREEIKVEYVLDCFYAECCIQRTLDAHDILANNILKFKWKIAGRSTDYTTLVFWNKLKKYGGLRCRTSCFDDFIWAFNDKRYDGVLSIADGVLFRHLPPGDRGRPEPPIQDKIVRMIAILHSDTYPDKERWLGHPCIPRRVFGPREYLVDPPLQLSKLSLRWLCDHCQLQVVVQWWCRTNPEARSEPSSHPEPQATHAHQRIRKIFPAVSSCHGSRLYLPTSTQE